MKDGEGKEVDVYGTVPDEVFEVLNTIEDAKHFHELVTVNNVNWLIYRIEVPKHGLHFIGLRMVSLKDNTILLGGCSKSLDGLMEELRKQVN